jgi:hypothetical protein
VWCYAVHACRWFLRQGRDELRDINCFQTNRYEPYLVLRRCAPTPRFAEAFTGYGKNKIQHIAHLRLLGFGFTVLPPGAFLVHFPHRESRSKKSWLNRHNPQRLRMDQLYSHFLSWAFHGADRQYMTKLCDKVTGAAA